MWEIGSLNWAKFMLQWFTRFPEFSEILFHLGKTQLCSTQTPRELQKSLTCSFRMLQHKEILHHISSWNSFNLERKGSGVIVELKRVHRIGRTSRRDVKRKRDLESACVICIIKLNRFKSQFKYNDYIKLLNVIFVILPRVRIRITDNITSCWHVNHVITKRIILDF